MLSCTHYQKSRKNETNFIYTVFSLKRNKLQVEINVKCYDKLPHFDEYYK